MKTSTLSPAFLALLLVTAGGCKGEGEATSNVAANAEATVANESTAVADAFVEVHEGGSVAWNVGADGSVKAALTATDGKPIKDDVSGSLVWKANGEPKSVPLTLDAKTGVFVAAGPKLEADLTEIDYTFNVSSKPWTGALHVPVGGTAKLMADARAEAEIKVPEGKIGPNGGVIQVVGKDRLELVADEVSGEVRVYVLDPDFNVVAVGDRTISLGVVAEAPEIVALAAAEGGAYFVGKWKLAVDPLKVTIALRSAGATHVALVGYRPGAKVVVTAAAPRLKVRTKTKWAVRADANADVDADLDAKLKGEGKALGHAKAGIDVPDVHGKALGHAKADVKGPDVKVKVAVPKIEVPKVSVKAGASAGAGAGAGAKAGAKAGAGAGVKFNLH